MSDQPPDPTDEPRTFWYRCAWGHIEERELASEDAPPLRCGANIAGVPGAPIASLCTAELRFYGPTVGEWRAANLARDAEHAQRLHVERLLAAADQALSECSGQLDTAMRSEGELRAQLDSAEREVEHLRGQASGLGPIYPRLADALAALRVAVAPRDIRLSYAQLVEATVVRITELEQSDAEQRGQLAAHRSASADAAALEAEVEGLRESVKIAKAAMHEAQADARTTRLSEAACQDALAVASEDHRRAVALGMEIGEQGDERVAVAKRHQETAERDRDEARALLKAGREERDKPVDDARAAAIRERDKARAERQDYANRLATLRAFLNAEAEEAERRGRHRLAARWREAKTASWHGVKVESGYTVISETIDGAAVSGTFLSEAIAAVLAEKAREVEEGAKLAEFGAAGGRLGSLFRDTIADDVPLAAWRIAIAELRELYALDSDASTLIRKAVYEIREARRLLMRSAETQEETKWSLPLIRDAEEAHRLLRAKDEELAQGRTDFEELRQRMLRAERKVGELRNRSQGFTVVRDVNQQTERERDKAREELRAALTMRSEARSVAAWAVSALTNVHHDYPEARAAYERAIDAATDSDWDVPPAAAAEILGEGTLTFPPDCAVRVKAGTLLAIDDGRGLPLVRAKVESIEIHADGLGPYDALLILDRSHLRVNDLH